MNKNKLQALANELAKDIKTPDDPGQDHELVFIP